MTIPLYGFVAGDSLGLIVLIDSEHTVAELAARVQRAAAVRVAPSPRVGVYFSGKRLSPELTVAGAGLTPLDRIDVIPEGSARA